MLLRDAGSVEEVDVSVLQQVGHPPGVPGRAADQRPQTVPNSTAAASTAALGAGALNYLLKPFTAQQLVDRLVA
ncbi:hypothetical protein GCM10010429_24330 [Micromonospora olivasterospora]